MLLWLSHVILVNNGHLLKSCDVRREYHMFTVAMVTIIVLAYVECEMFVHMATVVRRACSFSMG